MEKEEIPMSTESCPTEAESFHEFIGKKLVNGGKQLSADELLTEFRAHQQLLERFIRETQNSVDQANRGETRPLDTAALKHRVRERLASDGITD
jgi:hypothetical protein